MLRRSAASLTTDPAPSLFMTTVNALCNPIQDMALAVSMAASDSSTARFIAARLQGAELRDAVQPVAWLAAQVIAKFNTLVDVISRMIRVEPNGSYVWIPVN